MLLTIVEDLLAKGLGIGKLAIVRHGDDAITGMNDERLRKLDILAAAGGRVARVTNA